MKHRISVYTTTSTTDAGGLTQNRSLLLSSWAFVHPISQARAFQYGITENFRTHEIIMRYRSTITTKQTIDATINGTLKTLTIQSVLNTDLANKEMKLICTEND